MESDLSFFNSQGSFRTVCEKIFKEGKGAEQIMELPIFNELFQWMELLIAHHGTWPTKGIETELGPEGRKFIPME